MKQGLTALVVGLLLAMLFRSPLIFLLALIVAAIVWFKQSKREDASIPALVREPSAAQSDSSGPAQSTGEPLSEPPSATQSVSGSPDSSTGEPLGGPPLVDVLRRFGALDDATAPARKGNKLPDRVPLGPRASATILAYFLPLLGEHRPEFAIIAEAAYRVGRGENLTRDDGFALMKYDPKGGLSNLLVFVSRDKQLKFSEDCAIHDALGFLCRPLRVGWADHMNDGKVHPHAGTLYQVVLSICGAAGIYSGGFLAIERHTRATDAIFDLYFRCCAIAIDGASGRPPDRILDISELPQMAGSKEPTLSFGSPGSLLEDLARNEPRKRLLASSFFGDRHLRVFGEVYADVILQDVQHLLTNHLVYPYDVEQLKREGCADFVAFIALCSFVHLDIQQLLDRQLFSDRSIAEGAARTMLMTVVSEMYPVSTRTNVAVEKYLDVLASWEEAGRDEDAIGPTDVLGTICDELLGVENRDEMSRLGASGSIAIVLTAPTSFLAEAIGTVLGQ